MLHLQKTRDLAFELLESPGAKFLVVVCDNADQRSRLKEELQKMLAESGQALSYIQADSIKHDFLRKFTDATRLSETNAKAIWGIENLPPEDVRQLFAQLNVHRDWLSTLNVPLVLWLTPELLNELAKTAPDFWSRRSGIYHFSDRSFEKILGRMFSQESNKGREWNPAPALSEAFESILLSEKMLSDCLRHKTAFSIANLDACIEKVQNGVSQLLEECRNGRQIEIAFWLWGLGHLDNELQEMLDKLEPTRRTLFESLYTDRNEVLLHFSEHLTEFPEKYLLDFKENIKKKKRISIVGRARAVSISRIRKMALAIVSSVEIPLSADMDEMEEWFSARLEETRAEPQENTFLAQAADDLEVWLAGNTQEPPPFFSSEEASLLKLLYAHPANASAIAQELGTSQRQATFKMRYLERKVRLYLGLPPRFRFSSSRQ